MSSLAIGFDHAYSTRHEFPLLEQCSDPSKEGLFMPRINLDIVIPVGTSWLVGLYFRMQGPVLRF